jgi:hypothetical protein
MNNINRENKLIIIVSNSDLSNEFTKKKLMKLTEYLQENEIVPILHDISTMATYQSLILEVKDNKLLRRIVHFNYATVSVFIKRKFPTSIFINDRNAIDPWEFDVIEDEDINQLVQSLKRKKKRARFNIQ